MHWLGRSAHEAHSVIVTSVCQSEIAQEIPQAAFWERLMPKFDFSNFFIRLDYLISLFRLLLILSFHLMRSIQGRVLFEDGLHALASNYLWQDLHDIWGFRKNGKSVFRLADRGLQKRKECCLQHLVQGLRMDLHWRGLWNKENQKRMMKNLNHKCREISADVMHASLIVQNCWITGRHVHITWPTKMKNIFNSLAINNKYFLCNDDNLIRLPARVSAGMRLSEDDVYTRDGTRPSFPARVGFQLCAQSSTTATLRVFCYSIRLLFVSEVPKRNTNKSNRKQISRKWHLLYFL